PPRVRRCSPVASRSAPLGALVAYGAACWRRLAGCRHAVALPAGSSGTNSIAWSRDQSRLFIVTTTYGHFAEVWSTPSAGGGTPVEVTNFNPHEALAPTVAAPDTTPATVSATTLPAI